MDPRICKSPFKEFCKIRDYVKILLGTLHLHALELSGATSLDKKFYILTIGVRVLQPKL